MKKIIISSSVHRRSCHALDAGRDEVSEREVVGCAVVGQQDLHLHLRRKVQAAQEEGVQGTHGRRIRVHD